MPCKQYQEQHNNYYQSHHQHHTITSVWWHTYHLALFARGAHSLLNILRWLLLNRLSGSLCHLSKLGFTCFTLLLVCGLQTHPTTTIRRRQIITVVDSLLTTCMAARSGMSSSLPTGVCACDSFINFLSSSSCM
jgi:hypothetical protein